MAVILVSTVGASNANSYVSLTEADSYFEAMVNGVRWLAEPQALRTVALIQATRQVEELGGVRSTASPARPLFGGTPYSEEQALHFPRSADVAADGETLTIPEGIRHAVCEQALWLVSLKSDPDVVDHERIKMHGVQSFSADGISVSYTQTTRPDGIAPRAWALVQPYRSGGVTAKVVV